MTVLREAFVLPALFVTVALLGGFRSAESVRLLPPPVMALVLGMLLVGCLSRSGALAPDALLNARRTPFENVSGLVVLLTLFAASAQAFNLVTPDAGFLHLLFSVFFLVQLLTTLAAVRDRVSVLRGLAVLFGAAFLIRFVLLESLFAPEGGTLKRVLAVLLEGASLGAFEYSSNTPMTGYLAFLALTLYLLGLALLPAATTTGQGLIVSRGDAPEVTEGTVVARPDPGLDRVVRLAVPMLALCVAGCSEAVPSGVTVSGATDPDHRSALHARDRALASARVWREPAMPIARVDFSANPPNGWRPDDDVACRFVAEPVSGTTPKFDCKLPDGEVVKVKYGKANEEIYSEVAASRLLTALGFGADQMFVVRSVQCDGCPRAPFLALRCLARTGVAWPCFLGGPDYGSVRSVPHAVIERRMPGRVIEVTDGQGWAWFELDNVDPGRGGSTRRETDALRLMAVLLSHWDNKSANQRLVCLPEGQRPDGSCATPFAFMQDLGAEFGPRKVDLLSWRRTPVWADAKTCRVSMRRLPWGGGTFPDAHISEEGRRFLLGLLDQLTQPQLEALFTASRITSLESAHYESRLPGAWARAFLDKVRQVRDAGPCPQ
jgi:hypothetical protein